MKKTCIHCNNEKELDLFVTDSRNKVDGKSNVCKSCKGDQIKESSRYKDYKAKHKRQYAEDPEYRNMMKDKAAAFRRDHNDQVLLSQAKIRSNRFGLEFNLDLSDIIIPEFCPILGVKLVRGTKTKSTFSPSLDRIDNSKGYIKGNVRVISNLANTMKNNATKEQLFSFADNIKSYLNDDIV